METITVSYEKLVETAKAYLPEDKVAVLQQAYDFAQKCHDGQFRASGEPYLEHPLHVAQILAELQMDSSTLAASLMHDVVEDCHIPVADITKKFGAEIGKLVDGTTKLERLARRAPEAKLVQAENLRKMLMAMAEDLRVVFIKLADRLHNMRTLDALPPTKRQRIAQETLDIYAPLAHRLGIWELKWQLEDLSFRFLDPVRYRHVARLVASRREEREEYINNVIHVLQSEFEKAGLRAEISGRAKHIYSIYQKTEKYAAMGKDFDDIHDLLALRVIVSTVPDCYTALGIIHNLWRPIHAAFNDFIANPKPNGYQSLHTAVMSLGKTPLEVQIRTREMHYASEYGVAAHWRYKEGTAADHAFEQRVGWLRQLIEWHREFAGAEEFLESAKTDIFIDQVFVYTPKGDIKDLPKGATPLDFAYRVHTELGHRCIGAKVDGRMVPLNYQLQNGEMIEIITSKEPKGPSRDWMSPHLGFVQTSHAIQKIRQWFTKQERAETIDNGRKILEKELRHLGIKISEQEKLVKLFNFDNLEEFLLAMGQGSISSHQIALKLAAQDEQPRIVTGAPQATEKESISAIQVLGTDDLLTHLARCCNPVPGDKIIGYVTRTRGVTVHRQDCYNINHQSEKERLIMVGWGQTQAVYPVSVSVEAWDRVGLMRDITTLVAAEKVNITAVGTTPHDDQTVTLSLTMETKGLAQLSRLLAKIEGIQGVTAVNRIGDRAATKAAPSA